jgi:four helix bundle protein
LIDQMRRAATSIATNIAEGCGKYSQKDFVAYLQVSQSSSQEIEYLAILSKDLEYITSIEYEDLNQRVNEVKAMLISLIQKVRRDNNLT